MYEVYGERSGRVVARCKDVITAHRRAQDWTSASEWVDNEKYDYRIRDDERNIKFKRAQRPRRKVQC